MITDIKVTKFMRSAMNEMFTRVGFKKFDQSFVKNHIDWYCQRTWTQEEEIDYRKWFVINFKKTFKSTTLRAQKEANWFLLCWGWKNTI